MKMLYPSVQQKIISFVEHKEKKKEFVDGISIVTHLQLRADIVYANIQVLLKNKTLIRCIDLTGSSLRLVKNL